MVLVKKMGKNVQKWQLNAFFGRKKIISPKVAVFYTLKIIVIVFFIKKAQIWVKKFKKSGFRPKKALKWEKIQKIIFFKKADFPRNYQLFNLLVSLEDFFGCKTPQKWQNLG